MKFTSFFVLAFSEIHHAVSREPLIVTKMPDISFTSSCFFAPSGKITKTEFFNFYRVKYRFNENTTVFGCSFFKKAFSEIVEYEN